MGATGVPARVVGVATLLAFSALAGGLSVGTPALAHPIVSSPSASGHLRAQAPVAPPRPSSLVPQSTATSLAFDQRVRAEASALAAAGIPAREIRLPYAGASAQVVDGAVVPGYAVAATNVSMSYTSAPAPSGVAYYGENDTHGRVQSTTLEASSVAGSLTVQQMDALYLDVDTPDMWGVQLNAVLGDVTLAGTGGYEFWVQNTVDVFQHNSTINFGEDTWNFSQPGSSVPSGTSTILEHNPNGSDVAGLYLGNGPWIRAPEPFTLTLYVNSSLTASGDQELWYNYSVNAAGGVNESGNYDWVVFNTGGSAAHAGIAPFVASGTQLDPVGLPNDFELDYGIGGYNGADMDVLAANASATLDYCPITTASCTPSEYLSVPAAENFGGETGETATGISTTYEGTTAYASAGPLVLRGLWGFAGALDGVAGGTPVTNAIAVTGDPVPSSAAPYVFVFFTAHSTFDTQPEWAPDAPVWYLPAGTYTYWVMLADHAEEIGSLSVGSAPTALSTDLAYNASEGVYTPLWAFTNDQLAGISTSGNGTVGSQYAVFNNPTDGCTACGGASSGNLSTAFLSTNDYLFPSFPGLLFDGTTAYVDVNDTVSFQVYSFSWGVLGPHMPGLRMDLQIQLVSTEDVTLSDTTAIGGWPAMFETQTLAGLVNASQNPFPQASVMIWNSSHDLVMGNTFESTPTVPDSTVCIGVCPAVVCSGCVPPDELLLYGGSANTVWGNTFEDPTPLPSGGTELTSYAGLAEAESGDLVYNNNFTVDNPAVYLPFDLYTDACPDGYAGGCGPLTPPAYADRWNVTPQPAADVSDQVNGFSLSGNVLGLACPMQGGNYWSTYGDPLNPSSSLPFVNRYNYSEIEGILSAGSPVRASLLVGGDQYPLTVAGCATGSHDSVRFHGLGLPRGATWSVRLDGEVDRASDTPWLNATVAPGPLAYVFSAPVGYGVARVTGTGTPGYTETSISGTTVLSVRFGALEPVVFAENLTDGQGLPNGTSWGVNLLPSGHGGPLARALTTTHTSLSLTLPKGTAYRFVVSKPAIYHAAPAFGTVSVPGHALTKLIAFRTFTSALRFVEHGLDPGTNWSVTLTPSGGQGTTLYGTGSSLEFLVTNGTYSFTVAAIGPDQPTPSNGSVTMTAPHTRTVTIGFGSG